MLTKLQKMAHLNLPPLILTSGPQTMILPPISTILQHATPPLSSGQGHCGHLGALPAAPLQLAQPRARRLAGNRPSLRWSHATYTNTAPPAEELQETEDSAIKITRVYDQEAVSEILAITAAGTVPVQSASAQHSQQHQALYAETSLSVATHTEIHYESDESGELDIEREKLSPALDLARRWREAAPEERRDGVVSSSNPPRWRPSQDTQTRPLHTRRSSRPWETLMDMELPSTRVTLSEADLAAPSDRYRLYDAPQQPPAEEPVVEVEMIEMSQPQSVVIPCVGPPARSPNAIRAMMGLSFLC